MTAIVMIERLFVEQLEIGKRDGTKNENKVEVINQMNTIEVIMRNHRKYKNENKSCVGRFMYCLC